MKLVKSGPTGSDETATYDVVEYPKKVTDFIQEVLKRINEWGSITIKGYGSIDYKYGKLSYHIPKELSNLTISDVKASGGWSYMCYYLSVEQQEKASCIDFEERYNKLKAVSHRLYTAAQYLSDNPNSAESLREAMKEYYNFINNIK